MSGLKGKALWEAAQVEFAKKFALQSSYTAGFDFVYDGDGYIYFEGDGNVALAAATLMRPAVRACISDILSQLAGHPLLALFGPRGSAPRGTVQVAPEPEREWLPYARDNAEAPTLRDRYMMAVLAAIVGANACDTIAEQVAYADKVVTAALDHREEEYA